nr:hypothetical protein GCM10020092_068580 [Actinoplanes digitatis]
MSSCRAQIVSQPVTQYSQAPQARSSQGIATRSPTAGRVTPAPAFSTMPTPSWPGMNGGCGRTGQSPRAAWMSVWHRPLASIRTRTCPGPGSGSGTLLTSSGRSKPVTMAARIDVPPSSSRLNLAEDRVRR